MHDKSNSRSTPEVDVEFVIPCKNEAKVLDKNIARLLRYLEKKANYSYRVVIASNGSTDNTPWLAKTIARKNPNLVRVVNSQTSGRGWILKRIWQISSARVVAYMDADLATDLASLPRLVNPLLSNQADIVIGNRHHPKSRSHRTKLRQLMGHAYTALANLLLGLKIGDFQCGFKALRRNAAIDLLAHIKDSGWFFDTELIDLALAKNYRLKEIPVKWRESSDSSVRFGSTIFSMIAGLNRLSRSKKKLITPERVLLAALLLIASMVYLNGLQSRGWANPYYTMATQSAASSWKAFFFGSLDMAGFVTIDKLPMVVWPSVLSVRLFGLNDFAILWPYAAAGVGSIYFLYKLIRQDFGVVSGLVAGLVFLILPVGVLIFRFNNPDAYLVLFLLMSAYFFRRMLVSRGWRDYLLLGLSFGLAFQAKTMQALILLPIFILIAIVAKRSGSSRLDNKKLISSLVVFLLMALWWPLAVSLIPATNRPYIGSTTNNNVWQQLLGYNGIARLDGKDGNNNKAKSISGFGGQPQALRLLKPAFGVNIGLVIPFALVVFVLALWRYRVFKSVNGRSAQIILWGGWLILYGLVFSLMRGAIHPYYVVVLIPPSAALFAIAINIIRFGSNKRTRILSRVIISTAAVFSILIVMPYVMSGFPSWQQPITTRMPLVAIGIGVIIIGQFIMTMRIRLWLVMMAIGLILIVPMLSAAETAGKSYTGFMPTALPLPADTALIPSFKKPNQKLVQYLTQNAPKQTWLAATINSIDAASLQLMSARPVMALGGFAGRDSIMTSNQLERLVAQNKVRYFVVSETYLGGRCDDKHSEENTLFYMPRPFGANSPVKGSQQFTTPFDQSCALRLNLDVIVTKQLGPWLERHSMRCYSSAGWVIFDMSERRCQE